MVVMVMDVKKSKITVRIVDIVFVSWIAIKIEVQ